MLHCGDGAKCEHDDNRTCGSTFAAVLYFCSFIFLSMFLVGKNTNLNKVPMGFAEIIRIAVADPPYLIHLY